MIETKGVRHESLFKPNTIATLRESIALGCRYLQPRLGNNDYRVALRDRCWLFAKGVRLKCSGWLKFDVSRLLRHKAWGSADVS